MSKKILETPAPVGEYLIKTLNNMGVATTYLDEYAQQFIHYASQQSGPVLEIGACYGSVSIAALEAGATVIANDLDPRHLDILYRDTPEYCRSRLSLLPGKFPEEVHLAKDSIAGCYIARTIGYMDLASLQEGFENIFACLKPDALLFIISGTIYNRVFKDLIPAYEKRVLANEEWPGYFTNMKEKVADVYIPYVPEKLHFLDDNVLGRELNKAGFIVEQTNWFPREDFSPFFRLDGREGLAVIARKPG